MTDNALLANLIMDKFRKGTTGGSRKRRRTRSKVTKKKRTKHWKLIKLPSGMFYKMAKKGWIGTPSGRYVRDTSENRAKYQSELEYEPGATDVPFAPEL